MSKQTEALNLTGAAPFWEKRERRGKEQRLAEQQDGRKRSAANYEANEAKKEVEHEKRINYGIFLRILTEKLGISGLSIDRENPDQPELLAQQLRTIKSVFDQLHIASHLLNLSPEQNRLFSDFNWNSRRIVDIIPALDSEDLNHRNLSAFASSLRPTMFTDYGQILRVSEISHIEDPKERHQAVAQLMSELDIEKVSVKKLTKFFETQPTLAQVREQIAKQQWLQRLFWKSASTLGLLLMTAGCVAVTPETTSPPGAPVLEVSPEPTEVPDVISTPTAVPTIVTPVEQGGPITPDQKVETEQLIAQYNLEQQARQLIPGIKLLGVDEWVSAPTQPEDNGFYPFAWKRIGDSIALEEIGAHEDNSRHYLFFDYKNNKVAFVKADANTYVTVDPTGNWVVLDADNRPAQEIEWQIVGDEETPEPTQEVSQAPIVGEEGLKEFVSERGLLLLPVSSKKDAWTLFSGANIKLGTVEINSANTVDLIFFNQSGNEVRVSLSSLQQLEDGSFVIVEDGETYSNPKASFWEQDTEQGEVVLSETVELSQLPQEIAENIKNFLNGNFSTGNRVEYRPGFAPPGIESKLGLFSFFFDGEAVRMQGDFLGFIPPEEARGIFNTYNAEAYVLFLGHVVNNKPVVIPYAILKSQLEGSQLLTIRTLTEPNNQESGTYHNQTYKLEQTAQLRADLTELVGKPIILNLFLRERNKLLSGENPDSDFYRTLAQAQDVNAALVLSMEPPFSPQSYPVQAGNYDLLDGYGVAEKAISGSTPSIESFRSAEDTVSSSAPIPIANWILVASQD